MAEITKVEATETGGIAGVTPADEAAGKLDSEIKGSKNESAKAIVEYLKKRARESENLANDILKPSKTWNKCWEYIYSKAAKLPREGRVLAVRDETVYEWAEDYYLIAKEEKKTAEKKPAPSAKPKKTRSETAAKKPAAEKPKEPAPNVQLAEKDLYYKTGDNYWMVRKGAPLPTADSLKDAVEVTADEYEANDRVSKLRRTLEKAEEKTEGTTISDADATETEVIDPEIIEPDPLPSTKAPARDTASKKEKKEKKPKKPKKNDQIEGQMSLFDMFGG